MLFPRSENALVGLIIVAVVLARPELTAAAAGTTNNPPDWWASANFYQIYPRSFADANGDGIGDLNGTTARLPYLAALGITAIWLSPIFQSPMVDFGYDCSDYTRIHAEYGTLADFERLVAACRELNIKLILDFVPNHTSDQHEWFVKSAARVEGFENFYVWHPGRGIDASTGERLPPSNWLSMFRGRAWTWHDGRGEWYLHQFVKEQPDLNYRDAGVVAAMKAVLRLWLDRGVDGFRIDAVKFMFEAEPNAAMVYPDEQPSGECEDTEDTCYLLHEYTQDLDDTYDMIYQWRAEVDEWSRVNAATTTRIIMTEAYTTLPKTVQYYGEVDGAGRAGAQVPFNFELITNLRRNSSALEAKRIIASWLDAMPTGARANWVLGNHDNPRIATRFGSERVDLFNILLQTLPGIAVTYYGEELGLSDGSLRWHQTIDPAGRNAGPMDYEQFSRDPVRLPMPWSAEAPSAGFSTNASTWLPMHPDVGRVNAEAQQWAPFSHWKTFRGLTLLRQSSRTMREGSALETHANGAVLLFVRRLEGSETVVVLLNFAEHERFVDVGAVLGLPERTELEVLVVSVGAPYLAGDVLPARDAVAYGNVGVVFLVIEAGM